MTPVKIMAGFQDASGDKAKRDAFVLPLDHRVQRDGGAAEGRTVFVSSHLMSEMAQTATRLVVLRRGRLTTETSVEDFTGHATAGGILVRTSETARLGQLLAAQVSP